jgi:copper resistance protein B
MMRRNSMVYKELLQIYCLTLSVLIASNTIAQDIDKQSDPLEKSWPTPNGIPSEWPEPVMDSEIYTYMQFDRIETGFGNDNETYTWDFQAWAGGDYHKIWIKSEGEGVFDDSLEDMEVQVLYSRLLSSFWDLQIGGSYDIQPNSDRGHAVIGLQGVAPYWFEIDTAIFLSDQGNISFRAEIEYDLLLSQRLTLQPRLEINASAQDIPEIGIGSGINSTELGLRLRYEIRREFAPYIGISWKKQHGETANLIRAKGELISDFSFILGLRIWY